MAEETTSTAVDNEPTLFDGATAPATTPAEPGATPPVDAAGRPDWFPESHWKDGKPDLDGFKEAAKGEWLASRPESADKYELPKIEGLVDTDMNDAPIMQWWRETAFGRGLSQEDFQKGIETYANQLALNTDAYSQQDEQYLQAERTKLGENADARLQSLGSWVRDTFQGEELAAISRVARSAAGVSVLERIMSTIKDGGGVIPKGADFEPSVSAGPNEDEIKALMQDRRYWQASMRDPAIVAKVNSFYDTKYGKRG